MGAFLGGEAGEHAVFVGHVLGDCVVDDCQAVWGEAYEAGSGVVVCWLALDESAPLQGVDAFAGAA